MTLFEDLDGLSSEDRRLQLEIRMCDALDLIVRYGQTDGSHHKMWVIDQMLRILLGENYEKTIKDSKDGEDGPDTYEWNEGIAP